MCGKRPFPVTFIFVTLMQPDHSTSPIDQSVEHQTRQGPRLSIRIDIWILPSDTEKCRNPLRADAEKVEAKLSDLLGTKQGGND